MVTVIIVNYNSHQLTARAATSALADQPQAQVIVIDNSENAAEAQLLRDALPRQVECIISPENIGFGNACNIGYSHACHDWILLLNPDVFVIPGCIAQLVAFLERTPRAGAVSPFVHWDDKLLWLAPPILMHTPFTELRMSILLRWPWLGSVMSRIFRRWALRCIRSEQPIKRSMLSGGHILLRRSAIEAAGGLFDPAFFMYFEDTDLCRRLRQSGSQLYLLPAARAVHEWCCTPDKSGISASSHQYYFKKHFPKSQLLAIHQKIAHSHWPIRLPPSHELGTCIASPVFPVPEHASDSWVLELSPQPLLIPALYFCGSGSNIQIPDELWCRLGPGDYWLRIAALKGGKQQIYHWQM